MLMHNPASPGELLKEFMGDRSATALAKHIGVARATLSRILNGRNAVTVDLSIRLGEALSLSPNFFAKAQLQHDLWVKFQKKRRRIRPLNSTPVRKGSRMEGYSMMVDGPKRATLGL